jgi:hypothetical protein
MSQENKVENHMFKCILETPDGEILIGRGPSPDFAFKEAVRNLTIAKTPKHGPWMWEEQVKKEIGNKG